jgi:hypothetical protein
MTKKVIPRDNYDQESNKKNYSLFDYDKDGNVDIHDIFNKCNSWLKYISFLYDVSIDNLPVGAIIGLTLTIISTVLISTGINNSNSTILKHNNNDKVGSFISYYSFSLAGFIILHVCVLLHGISIMTLETLREVKQIDEVGCYCCCKNKKTLFGKFCRCIQKCARVSTQAVWGVFGTIFMFLFYFLSVSYFVVSSVSTTVSYFLNKTCNLFSQTINKYKKLSLEYVSKAKQHVNSADAIALTILSEYNNWINLQQKFLDSGLGQINNIDGPTYNDSPEQVTLWEPEKPGVYEYEQDVYNNNCHCGRKLTTQNLTKFNPIQQIANGRSAISILNESIYQTEQQINYYDSQFKIAEEICYDYSSIYNSLYLISIGTGLLLLAQFIMFAVHYKYFSVWNYEVKLTKLNAFRITKK